MGSMINKSYDDEEIPEIDPSENEHLNTSSVRQL